jgi:anthranilate/para-aminobenzoate synthase component I
MKIGAGGAITRLSDPLEEWDEVELKARRIVETVAEIERTFGVKNTRRRER